MTISYRILQTADHNRVDGFGRIECGGQIYSEDELRETIWLLNMELRAGLPKRERIEAQNDITRYQALLDALRRAGA